MARCLSMDGKSLVVGGRSWPLNAGRRIRVVGMGKASAAMALPLEKLLGSRIESGLLIVKDGHGLPLQRIRIAEAGHPIPDHRGVEGVAALLRQLKGLRASDLAFCLVSGGGSALTPAPVDGITLEQKQEVTRLLLSSGATIHELNIVRKHLSRIKGGGLARRAFPAPVVSLVLSDVVGDDLGTIASGPTVADRSTFADALAVLERRQLFERVPPPVLRHLEAGGRGEIPETPKGDHPAFAAAQTLIVGDNQMALEAAGDKARRLGYRVVLPTSLQEGEARDLAADHLALAREIRKGRADGSPPLCLLSGGEATVTVRGPGLGGRNQEFVLAAVIELDGTAGITVLSGGTDGTDGPTDAAGAVGDGESCERARAMGLDPAASLAANDSYRFFQPLGDLLTTGPTLTNVLDLRLVLVA